MVDARDSIWNCPACVIYHGPGSLASESVVSRPAEDLFLAPSSAAPTVLLVDAAMKNRLPDLRQLPRHVVVVAADASMETTLGSRADLSVAGVPPGDVRDRLLGAACELAAARFTAMNWRAELVCAHRDVHDLKRIGMALMLEKDRRALLHQILDRGKALTASDGASLMLVSSDVDNPPPMLHAALVKFDSLPHLPARAAPHGYPVDNSSVIGHAALTKEVVVIDDPYNLPHDAVYRHNEFLDRTFGYRTRSMLIVPMIDRRDEVMGLLVFVNRKSNRRATIRTKDDADRYTQAYTDRDVRLARALASQAAISIENTRLYEQIENLLQSFVKAAATAIDQRDPTTAGHSLRVAALATDLAAAVERSGRGPYQNVRFSRAQMRELQFAALLHDFGKVGVKEDVLLKSKKLPVYLWERVNARFDLIRRTKEADHYRLRAQQGDRVGTEQAVRPPSDAQLHEQLDELTRMRELVRKANEPGLLPEAQLAELHAIARHTFRRPDGMVAPYLTDVEVRYLEIPEGTLDAQERVEIESHVEQTFQFLEQIPWTDDFKNMAMYAYGHHEKLDGSGYPRHVKAEDIPIQTRLLTLADMFDALTETDRPYKSAYTAEKALALMQDEAKRGALDPELVRILVESKVYKRVTEQDWRAL